MEGTDDSTELWRHPYNLFYANYKMLRLITIPMMANYVTETKYINGRRHLFKNIRNRFFAAFMKLKVSTLFSWQLDAS